MTNEKSLLTSRGNSNRLPALMEYLKDKDFKNILNFGCGMFAEGHAKEMKQYNINLVNYDKYIHGEEFLETLDMNKIDVIICSNVLNVIPDDIEITKILEWFKKQGKPIYISIYEGDRKNKITLNKNGCYQRNETKKVFYEKFLKDDYKKEKGFFKLD